MRKSIVEDDSTQYVCGSTSAILIDDRSHEPSAFDWTCAPRPFHNQVIVNRLQVFAAPDPSIALTGRAPPKLEPDVLNMPAQGTDELPGRQCSQLARSHLIAEPR